MLVTVKGFGGIWERRFGTNTAHSKRFAQAAFYNTTGVQVSGKVGFSGHPMLEHYRFVAAHSKVTPKITIPAPSAICDHNSSLVPS